MWYRQRWAEYLTFLVTASLLPFEIYEIVNRTTPFIAFVVNVAIVVYLLLAKRLFGLRGGAAANALEDERDQGWGALARTAPPTPAGLGGCLTAASHQAPEEDTPGAKLRAH